MGCVYYIKCLHACTFCTYVYTSIKYVNYYYCVLDMKIRCLFYRAPIKKMKNRKIIMTLSFNGKYEFILDPN